MIGTTNLHEETVEVRLLNLIQPPATILGRVVPAVRGCTDKCTRWPAVTEVDPVHDDDLIDDAADLARHLGALHLNLISEVAIELVGQLFENSDEHDVLA